MCFILMFLLSIGVAKRVFKEHLLLDFSWVCPETCPLKVVSMEHLLSENRYTYTNWSTISVQKNCLQKKNVNLKLMGWVIIVCSLLL